MTQNSRNLTIDSLRAIAALFVFAAHIIGYINTTLAHWEFLIVLAKGGVILFFLISGYCITLSLAKLGTYPVRNFLIRRFFRLYPIYWIAVLMAAMTTNKSILLPQLLYNMSMMQDALKVPSVNGVFWTLFIELVFYGLIIILLNLRLAYDSSVYGWSCLLLMSGALISAIIRAFMGIHTPFGHFMFISVFFLGGWAGMSLLHGQSMLKIYYAVFCYLIAIFLIEHLICSAHETLPYSHNLNYYCWPLLLFFIALERKWFAWQLLGYLGKISFCIYLFHYPIAWILKPWIVSQSFLFFLILLTTVSFSSLAYYAVEAQCIRLSQRLIRKLEDKYQFAS